MNSWFEINYNDPFILDAYFKEQLRIRKETFEVILIHLNPHLTRTDTAMHDCIPPEEVLALELYRLSLGNSYVSTGPTFNVGKSTVIEAVQGVVNALFDASAQFIKFSRTPAETTPSIETFRENTRSELVNVAGAIDWTHIKIIAPRQNALDYFSRYQQQDFIIQAVMDGRGKFINAVCGFPGIAHVVRVLRNSKLYYNADKGNILQAHVVTIGGRGIRPYPVGDSAYPQAPWLIKPFPEGTRNPEEQTFNKELSRARVTVERAFGILKSRWRVLQKRFDSSLEFAIKCAVACIVLHNICVDQNDPCDDDADDYDRGKDDRNDDVMDDGDEIRDFLKDPVCGNI